MTAPFCYDYMNPPRDELNLILDWVKSGTVTDLNVQNLVNFED